MTFAAILERDPVSPHELNPDLPPKLLEVISKLLEKDRELRYQSAADLRGDLKRLKRDIESAKTGKRASESDSRVAAGYPARPSSAHTGIADFAASGPPSSTLPARPSSSAVVAAARQHKFGLASLA